MTPLPVFPPVVPPLNPGLLVLHGNRLQLLADAVLSWLASHPLAPLEQETLLVQSNGLAEWLKMQIASAQGVCAAARLELPARFLWRAYRAVLGRGAVPQLSPLDKLPLTWRLMQLLPQLIDEPAFAPVAGFLRGSGGGAERRLQLAQRLADLYDQYQVYRSDWLHDWAGGDDRLRAATAAATRPVPPDQRWQPALWRAALATLTPAEQQATRPLLQQRLLQALQVAPAPGMAPPAWPGLPRRIVLFGTTHIPQQTLAALAALAAHCQVLIALPNPCRFHWADTIDGRELLRAPRRRHALRGGVDLAHVPLQDMHAHGHPLLSAWGRQAREAVRLLDAFDGLQQAASRDMPRVDLFDDEDDAAAAGRPPPLLTQVQAHIRDLLPLAEHPRAALAADDRSIVFQVAHGPQREVEILHDQLLQLFADPPGGQPLAPRDVVVMVPAIDAFAPAIRSVFGQHGRGHPRHIPWGISDQQDRGHHPLLVALEWLLCAPQQRFASSELRALLDVPAVLRRLGLVADDVPTLAAWMDGAGGRWGLHAGQRRSLGLGACGAVNSWHFALQRMLLGYAAGAADDGIEAIDGIDAADAAGVLSNIEPYPEVAGLAAGLAGALAELLTALESWWDNCRAPRTPAAWGARLRALLQQFFAATDDAERALLAALDDALTDWLQACEDAAFDAAVELAVVREAWLAGVDTPGVSRRFKAGGVTFCTLLPMRAVPFDVVCLLGMNDGDYPRRSARSDFDLMALPGQARPGDRSRRDDDRQLMLDALLSARRVLSVSWAGRSQRDNQPQPPSVLVAQLRDYLAAGWGAQAVQDRTVEHPLQPFSRRYFTAAPDAGTVPKMTTYASEWRAAHAPPAASAATAAAASAAPSIPAVTAPPPPALDAGAALDIQQLASFLRNPVKAFFRHRLGVVFSDISPAAADDEAFGSDGLARWQLVDDALQGARAQLQRRGGPIDDAVLQAAVAGQVARLQRAGRLPLGAPGQAVQAALQQTLLPVLRQWQALLQTHLPPPDAAAGGNAAAPWIELQAGRIADKAMKAPRPDRLLAAWLRCLASAAAGRPAAGVVIGTDAVAHVAASAAGAPAASSTLQSLLQASHDGVRGDAPLPAAVRTSLQHLSDPARARAVYEGGGPASAAGSGASTAGEGSEPCLARLFPDYSALSSAPGFDATARLLYAGYADWLAGQVSLQPLPDAAAAALDEADDV